MPMHSSFSKLRGCTASNRGGEDAGHAAIEIADGLEPLKILGRENLRTILPHQRGDFVVLSLPPGREGPLPVMQRRVYPPTVRAARSNFIGFQRLAPCLALYSQYVGTRCTERLAGAGIEPSVGTKGDSCDNALYKAELILGRAPWKTREAVVLATLEWASWFNNDRLMVPAGLRAACPGRVDAVVTARPYA
jgi:hypothetical protein